MKKYIFGLIALFTLIGFLLFTQDNSKEIEKERALDRVLKEQKLTIATRNSPTTYYRARDDIEGFEYDLAKDFGKFLGVEVEFKIYDSIDEILKALKSGEVDLASAGITKTRAREENFLFSNSYQEIEQNLICHRDLKHPKSFKELKEYSILVTASSSYSERLRELSSTYDLNWSESENLSTEQILELVWKKEVGCTVADSNIFDINRRLYPELEFAFSISQTQELAWPLSKYSNQLRDRVNEFFKTSKERIESLKSQYYGYFETFDYFDTKVFHDRVTQRLPKYEAMFKEASKEYSIDWILLASQSYQESHWNPKATSPTGVRGMMMLTKNTAKSLGVKNRLDPKESILGGAKYLSKMLSKVPKEFDDKLKFALASYNIGFGHMLDAIKLAKDLNKSSTNWNSLRDILPLLSQKRYYRELKYGYARGSEPVRYVDRIYNYYDILNSKIK